MDAHESDENLDCPFYQKLKNRPITASSDVVRVRSARSDISTQRCNRGVQRERQAGNLSYVPIGLESGDFSERPESSRSVRSSHKKLNSIPEYDKHEDDGCIKIHSLSSNATIVVPETRRQLPQVIDKVLKYENNFIRPRTPGTARNLPTKDRPIRTPTMEPEAPSASKHVTYNKLDSDSSAIDTARSRHEPVRPISRNLLSSRYDSRPTTGFSHRSAAFNASSEIVHRAYCARDDKVNELLQEIFQVQGDTYNEWKNDGEEDDQEARQQKRMEALENLYERIHREPRNENEQSYYEYKVLLGNIADLLNDFSILPVPPGFHLKCRVTRVKKGVDGSLFPQYFLHLQRTNGPDVLLMSAKRNTTWSAAYSITTDPSTMSTDSEHFLGVLKGNFKGSKFTLHTDNDLYSKPEDETEGNKNGDQILSVAYKPNPMGFKGPRKIKVITPKMKSNHERVQSIGKLHRMNTTQLIHFKNKEPYWNSEGNSFVLNFKGRVSLASVKNFQIVHADLEQETLLQFGRLDKNSFILDFRYPFSPLQAFAIALSSFDVKWGLE